MMRHDELGHIHWSAGRFEIVTDPRTPGRIVLIVNGDDRNKVVLFEQDFYDMKHAAETAIRNLETYRRSIERR